MSVTDPAPRRVEHDWVAHDELALLRAKAAVCEAYRAWLHSPNRDNRKVISTTLLEVHRLESADKP